MDLYENGTNKPYYYHHNLIGSVTGVTDDTGKLIELVEYDPYGKPYYLIPTDNPDNPYELTETGTNGNSYLFQGREYDEETGLYYFRARYYDPEIGRFLQPDPLGYHDSLNLYQAFNNNPVNFVDPKGTTISFDSESSRKLYEQFKLYLAVLRTNHEKSLFYDNIAEMIEQMEISELDFHIMYYRNFNFNSNQGDLSKEIGGITRPGEYEIKINNEKKKIRGIKIEVMIDPTNKYSALSRLVHELTHGYQFLTGQIGFIETSKGSWNPFAYDIFDEVEAHKNQFLFFDKYDKDKNKILYEKFINAKSDEEMAEALKNLYPRLYEKYIEDKTTGKSGRLYVPYNYFNGGKFIDSKARYLVEQDKLKRFFVSVNINLLIMKVIQNQIW